MKQNLIIDMFCICSGAYTAQPEIIGNEKYIYAYDNNDKKNLKPYILLIF